MSATFQDRLTRLAAAAFSPIGAIRRGFAIGASASGQWEGWERNRLRARPAVRLETQDRSLDYGTREKLMSEARILCQIDPISRRVLSKFANYCVGDCRYKWNTGDDAISQAYRDYWYSWMDRADAGGNHRYTSIAGLLVKSMLRDGDVFQSFVPAGPGGRDIQVRLVEGDRVGNYRGGSVNVDEDRIIGGIVRDASERPIAYRVNQRGKWGNFTTFQDVPAAQICHLFNPDRYDAARDVTAFRAVLNHLRDLKETIDAEKAAIKLNSKIALLVKTVMGGVRSGYGGVDLNENGDTSANSAKVNTQEINDAMTVYQFPGEEMKAHQSDRPGGDWLEYAEFMVHLISIGVDLPVGFVWKMLGTGPAVRFHISDAARTFDRTMDALEEKVLDPTVARVISNGIERGLIPPHPLWFKFERQRPPSVSIDIGRDSSAMINENDAWLRSAEDSFNESGQDAREQVKKIAMERAIKWVEARDAAAATGAPLEYILNPNPKNQPAAPAAAETGNGKMEEMEEQPMTPGKKKKPEDEE